MENGRLCSRPLRKPAGTPLHADHIPFHGRCLSPRSSISRLCRWGQRSRDLLFETSSILPVHPLSKTIALSEGKYSPHRPERQDGVSRDLELFLCSP
jgi:hypothetical protein